jgi:hypothetical protein
LIDLTGKAQNHTKESIVPNCARETEDGFDAYGTSDDAQDAEWRDERYDAEQLRCRQGVARLSFPTDPPIAAIAKIAAHIASP